MFRKILLIFITVFFISDNSLKALLALMVLSISLYFQRKLNPFNSKELNKLELSSSIVSLSTLYFGFFNYLVQSTSTKIILFLIVSVANAYFLLYWGYKMVLVNISKFHLWLKCFIKKICPNYLAQYKRFYSASIAFFLIFYHLKSNFIRFKT